MTTTKKVEKPSHSASGPEIMVVGASTKFISAVAKPGLNALLAGDVGTGPGTGQ